MAITPDHFVYLCSPRAGQPYYVVGPYANRVSFASQQMRAINLVYSLYKTNKLKPANRKGPRNQVAVIGGGVAGITAAAVLLGYGAHVTLFEKGAGFLPRQSETSHRVVNPTITQWPDIPLDYTTNLPLLNWYQDKCDGVSETLLEQFNAIIKENQRNFHPRFGERITRIGEYPAEKLMLEVNDISESKKYCAILATTGFGEEDRGESIGMINSDWVGYWTPDNIVDTRNNTPNLRYIISGVGDGGLLDALRIVHRNFNRGALPVEIANLIESKGLSQQIKNECHVFAKYSKEEAQEEYNRLFSRIARQINFDSIYDEINKKLNQSYTTGSATHIIVDKKYKYPVSHTSSIINKILVYHAIHAGKLDYEYGSLTVNENCVRTPNGTEFSRQAVRPIVRHGPIFPLNGFITENDQRFLKDKQLPYSDQLMVPLWNEIDNQLQLPAPLPKKYVGNSVSDRESKRGLVAEFVGRTIKSYCHVEVTKDGYDILTTNDLSSKVPKKAFGSGIITREPIFALSSFGS